MFCTPSTKGMCVYLRTIQNGTLSCICPPIAALLALTLQLTLRGGRHGRPGRADSINSVPAALANRGMWG